MVGHGQSQRENRPLHEHRQAPTTNHYGGVHLGPLVRTDEARDPAAVPQWTHDSHKRPGEDGVP